MTTDVYDFLEHRGVKGMKWGHRKARVAPGQQQKPDHSTRNAIGITIGVMAGAALVGVMLGKHGNKKAMAGLHNSEETLAKSNKIWDAVKNVKLSEMRSPVPGSSWQSLPNYPKNPASITKLRKVIGR